MFRRKQLFVKKPQVLFIQITCKTNIEFVFDFCQFFVICNMKNKNCFWIQILSKWKTNLDQSNLNCILLKNEWWNDTLFGIHEELFCCCMSVCVPGLMSFPAPRSCFFTVNLTILKSANFESKKFHEDEICIWQDICSIHTMYIFFQENPQISGTVYKIPKVRIGTLTLPAYEPMAMC